MEDRRIKVAVIFVLLVALSVALYLRRPKDTWEPKWGKGNLTLAERSYYGKNISAIINRWKKLGGRAQYTETSDQVFLVIDMDKKILSIEENGRTKSDEYIELAPGVDWTLYYYSTKSTSIKDGKVILRNINNKTVLKNPEQIILRGEGKKHNFQYTIVDTASQMKTGIINYNPGAFITSMDMDELGSPFIVTKGQYQQYINYVENLTSLQTDEEKKRQRSIRLLDGRIASWKKMEKKLYMEIEKRVCKAGYELTSIDVFDKYTLFVPLESEPYKGAKLSLNARHSSLVRRMLHKNSDLSASLVAIALDYPDIWYVACNPYLQKEPINPKFEFEFLIFLNKQPQSLKYSDFINEYKSRMKKDCINEGREKIKTIRNPNVLYQH